MCRQNRKLTRQGGGERKALWALFLLVTWEACAGARQIRGGRDVAKQLFSRVSNGSELQLSRAGVSLTLQKWLPWPGTSESDRVRSWLSPCSRSHTSTAQWREATVLWLWQWTVFSSQLLSMSWETVLTLLTFSVPHFLHLWNGDQACIITDVFQSYWGT